MVCLVVRTSNIALYLKECNLSIKWYNLNCLISQLLFYSNRLSSGRQIPFKFSFKSDADEATDGAAGTDTSLNELNSAAGSAQTGAIGFSLVFNQKC